jgi:hypothetical protein
MASDDHLFSFRLAIHCYVLRSPLNVERGEKQADINDVILYRFALQQMRNAFASLYSSKGLLL